MGYPVLKINQEAVDTEFIGAGEIKERIPKKLKQLCVGLDPEMMSEGMYVAGFHIEASARPGMLIKSKTLCHY